MSYRFKYGDRPLDDYTIQRAVGSGGFGEVYYAVSDGGREVALKYLRQNPESELRGVSHCINLKSPHLVSIFDVKKNADGDYFIIMEYCSGPSLRDLLIAEPNGFPAEKAAFFVREIAKGLAYLHDRGIVHRDLKPGNIFYDDGYVKIGDYGLSKFISVSRHSAQTASVGTVHYMAPEIGSGNYSRGVDIYALGVMLYEMLLGKVPFEGSSMAEILMKHLTSQPEVDNLPEPFGTVIRKALEKDPDDRYQNVNEMVDDLLAVDNVQKSLAGFSPQSLAGAVRAGEAHADAPMPSPNPSPPLAETVPLQHQGPPPVPPVMDLRDAGDIGGRVAKRMAKITKKLDKKMAKLASKGGGPAAGRAAVGQAVDQAGVEANTWKRTSRGKRFFPAIILTIGVSIGAGLIFGNAISEEAGGAAGLLIPMLGLAVGLTHKARSWFDDGTLPGWAGTIVTVFVGAPFLFVGGAPLTDMSPEHAYLPVVLGLMIVLVFADWDNVRESGANGELRVGGAIWMGIGGLVSTLVLSGLMDSRNQDYVPLAGFVAAASALVVQANCWWLGGRPGTRGPRTPRGGSGSSAGHAHEDQAVAAVNDEGLPPFAEPLPPRSEYSSGHGYAMGGVNGEGGSPVLQKARSGFARGFWSLVSFLLAGGAIALFVTSIVMGDGFPKDERVGCIVGLCACMALQILALSKISMMKRIGFWRESLRPFLLSVFAFGIGSCLTVLINFGRYWNPGDKAALISGLAISGLAFILLLAARGRKRHLEGASGRENRGDSPSSAVKIGVIVGGDG
ncbi:MAG: serine/threonine-protein kinase [Planctomycetota bacterium]|jgi:hypothetical protein